MTTKISEAKFEALKSKLRELFELDKSDLDFGIYRIMAAKNKEVTAFLDRHLRETVREVLESRGSDESTKLAGEIAKAREAAATAGFNPDDSPRVKELEEQYARLGGGSTEELEADIYNHLLNFFSRYYDEGDFISKRFYKGETYSIPYGGEEVALHWANKDQYYIKSGEWHKDYRFRINDKVIHFRLVNATNETGNNKELDEAKRRYILASDSPVIVDDGSQTMILRFEFRIPTEIDQQRVEDTEATRLFGGKYDKNTGRAKGDQREAFCADAELRALEVMPSNWKASVTTLAATEAKPSRTILGKHLDHFTARNAFDYFIHKDLNAFLKRELEFYIKNEVIRLDDIESLPDHRLMQIRGLVTAIRRVAFKTIDFLAKIEDFQRRLWLKKKFVLNTHWLVTVDRIPSEYRETIARCENQWNKWNSLGFRSKSEDGLIAGEQWQSIEYLNANERLAVSTEFLEISVAKALLSDVFPGHDKVLGELISGDNFHALRLLSRREAAAVDAIYIDPPYNTGQDDFLYKDDYQHSSWLSMYGDRLRESLALLSPNGVFSVSSNDDEYARMEVLHAHSIKRLNRLGEFIWRTRNTDNRVSTMLSVDHEYISVFSVGGSMVGRTIDRSDYKNPDNDPRGPYTTDPLTGKANYIDRPNLHYTIINEETGDEYPPDPDFGWITDRKGYDELLADKRIHWPSNPQTGKPRKKRFASEAADRSPASSLHITVKQSEGNGELAELMGSKVMNFPKPVPVPKQVLELTSRPGSLVLDFFAGSGTTGQAVLELNRESAAMRRFILVELGTYFATVLKPRIWKAMFSSQWSGGNSLTHKEGQSGVIKCFSLESYEDSLNNLPSPDGKLFEAMDQSTRDSLITYSLDLELGPHLLNMDSFKDPWGYRIYAQLAGEAEVSLHDVDMVETFNYLIGLKVQMYGPIERYSAEFVRLPHGDDKDSKGVPLPEDKREGRLRVEGRLRRDAEGPYLYQRVEGELNDGNATRVLVIWRKLTDDAERDAAVLEAWMARHRETTKERSDYREYHLIYLNGPITLPQPTQELRTVLPTEQTFKDRMFEDT
jgi:adenine-specific DNA-methyltransferase